MNPPTNRLTARDLISKSFSAKARRGYDPAEVDAFLMDVARQVDELNIEIDRLTNEVVRLSFGAQAPPPAPMPAPAPVVSLPEPEPVPAPAPVVAAAPAPAPSRSDAEEESLKLILKAAQRTAEQTIGDAKARGDEIVAEARFRAAEITRESDRRAFEAASRSQEELVRLEDDLKRRRLELDAVRRAIEAEKETVRELAQSLLDAVGTPAADEAAPATPASANGTIDLTSIAPPAATDEPLVAPAQG